MTLENKSWNKSTTQESHN